MLNKIPLRALQLFLTLVVVGFCIHQLQLIVATYYLGGGIYVSPLSHILIAAIGWPIMIVVVGAMTVFYIWRKKS